MISYNVKLLSVLSCLCFLNTAFAGDDAAKDQTNPGYKLPITSSWDLTSNYIFRGLTQTNNTGAVQGGITYTLPGTGIYGNVWGSNVKFPEDDLGHTAATLEFDTSIGFSSTIGDNFSYGLALTRYNYTQSAYFDYNELIANIQFHFITALVGYSNDVYATGEPGTYYNLGINYNVPEKYIFGISGVNILGGIGYYDLNNQTSLYTSYKDYKIQLAKTFDAYQVAVAWTDTDGKFFGPANWGNSKFVFTITANLS